MTKRMFIMLGGVLLLVAVLAFGFFLHIRTLIASAPKPGPQTVSAIKATDPRLAAAAVGGRHRSSRCAGST